MRGPKLNIANDDFIRTTEPRHKAAVAELLQRCYDAGDIELDTFAGKYCVACEEYYQDDELVSRARRCRSLSDPPSPRRVLRRGELLLPPVAFRGPPARLVRQAPDGTEARASRQRGDRTHQVRAARLLDQPHLARLGHPAAVGRQARHLRVVRRADQLPRCRRFRRRRAGLHRALAGRLSPHRQGHRAPALRVLAGHADVGRRRTAQGMGDRRLAVERRREDEQDLRATWSTRST